MGGGSARKDLPGGWQGSRDSNPDPTDLESVALTNWSYCPSSGEAYEVPRPRARHAPGNRSRRKGGAGQDAPVKSPCLQAGGEHKQAYPRCLDPETYPRSPRRIVPLASPATSLAPGGDDAHARAVVQGKVSLAGVLADVQAGNRAGNRTTITAATIPQATPGRAPAAPPGERSAARWRDAGAGGGNAPTTRAPRAPGDGEDPGTPTPPPRVRSGPRPSTTPPSTGMRCGW